MMCIRPISGFKCQELSYFVLQGSLRYLLPYLTCQLSSVQMSQDLGWPEGWQQARRLICNTQWWLVFLCVVPSLLCRDIAILFLYDVVWHSQLHYVVGILLCDYDRVGWYCALLFQTCAILQLKRMIGTWKSSTTIQRTEKLSSLFCIDIEEQQCTPRSCKVKHLSHYLQLLYNMYSFTVRLFGGVLLCPFLGSLDVGVFVSFDLLSNISFQRILCNKVKSNWKHSYLNWVLPKVVVLLTKLRRSQVTSHDRTTNLAAFSIEGSNLGLLKYQYKSSHQTWPKHTTLTSLNNNTQVTLGW
jgi:hypothetical protein